MVALATLVDDTDRDSNSITAESKVAANSAAVAAAAAAANAADDLSLPDGWAAFMDGFVNDARAAMLPSPAALAVRAPRALRNLCP